MVPNYIKLNREELFKEKIMKKKATASILIILFFIVLCKSLIAQEVFGLSYQYEYFPSAKLADPTTNLEDMEIQTSTYKIGAAFPLVLAKGKIIILNSMNYRHVNFNYKNHPPDARIDQTQSIEYTAFMIDSLSAKWSMVVVITPGVASDFESKVTADDFSFQGVFGFMRKFSEKFSLGSGIAYSREFGPSIPMPFIYFEWIILPKLSAKGLLPIDLNFLYKYNKKFDFGLFVGVSGNRYHGSPTKYDVDNPQMEYSEGTVSPKMQYHITDMLHLNIEGGYTFYRNFELLDGDKSHQSFDMENSGYLRASFVFGI